MPATNKAARPLGPHYQVVDARALRHVHAETVYWLLGYLGCLPLAEVIDRVVLIGPRAGGHDLEGVHEQLAAHEFMIVLDEQAPEDVMTGGQGYPTLLQKLHAAARVPNVLNVNVMLCRKSHWTAQDDDDDSQMNKMRRGVIIAARL